MAVLLDILAAGVVDSSGDPLDSGVVYVYTVGTTTKMSLFTDSDGTQTTSNPITLDSAGKAEVYVEAAARLVIESSAGATIDDIESVGDVASLLGDVTIGTNSNNTLSINSQLSSDIIPASDDTYDLGQSDQEFAEAYIDDLTVSGEMKGARCLLTAIYPRQSGAKSDGYITPEGAILTERFAPMMTRGGSVLGMSAWANVSAYTAGATADVGVRKNDSEILTVQLAMASTGIKTASTTQARGTDTFSAGDTIEVYVDWDAAADMTTGIFVLVELQFDT